MNNEITEVINTLSEKFGIVIDWTQQNIQPYIQDLMNRLVQCKLTEYIILSVFSFIMLCVSIYFFCWGMKKIFFNSNNNLMDEDVLTVCVVLSIILFVINLVILYITIGNIVECIYVPEKVFIKEIQTIIK